MGKLKLNRMNYSDMISYYSSKNKKFQLVVAIEELSELIKELTKDLRGKGNIEHISEEISHVKICIDVLLNIYQNRLLVMHYTQLKCKDVKEV